MAYEKQTWQCGDVVTADKLNHMEDGIANAGGGGMVIRIDHAEYDEEGAPTNEIYDKTWKEVNDALEKGQIVVVKLFDALDNAIAIAFCARSTTRPTRAWLVDIHRFGDYAEPVMTLEACSEDGYLQSAQCNSGDGGK